eukprot:4244527-Amphidinium_carterae.1
MQPKFCLLSHITRRKTIGRRVDDASVVGGDTQNGNPSLIDHFGVRWAEHEGGASNSGDWYCESDSAYGTFFPEGRPMQDAPKSWVQKEFQLFLTASCACLQGKTCRAETVLA